MTDEYQAKNPPLLFDEKTQAPQLNALKAAIPYMEPSVGKMAALAVKLFEIKIIMDSFESEIAVQTMGDDRERRIIEELRPYFGEDMAIFLDFSEKFQKMRCMAEMMGMLNSADNSGGK